jgi:hypothetical protein
VRQRIPLLFFVLAGTALLGQTTQGLIYGRVTQSGTDTAVGGAQVRLFNDQTPSIRAASTDTNGSFVFLLLTPGEYWLRVESPAGGEFQPAEVHGLVLPVAGSLLQVIGLRRLSDTFEESRRSRLPVSGSEQIEQFYGPDLDLSRVAFVKKTETDIRINEPSVSAVIDTVPILDLPLQGRDAFAMLAMQPAVTSDSSTARSLGLSANGVRPSASNFLADGLELNNYLVGGPIVALPPEAVQEYRVSTNGFSAEYGQTAGYIVNAVTRSATSRWHVLGYFYLTNEALNANDFQNNALGAPRPRLREYQPGYWAGGPLRKPGRKSLFLSSGSEYVSSRGSQPEQSFLVPSAGFTSSLASLPSTNPARTLMSLYHPPASIPVAGGEPFAGIAQLSPLAVVTRPFSMNRLDGNFGDLRYFARTIDARTSQPDFIWSPYSPFISGLSQGADGVAAEITWAPSSHPGLATQARFGLTYDRIGWDRAHPELPTLLILSGNPGAESPLLPGSPAAYSYSYRSRTAEFGSNTVLHTGRQTLMFGGAGLLRDLDSVLPYAQSGLVTFSSLASFETGADPLGIRVYSSFDRSALAAGSVQAAQFDRHYQYPGASTFVQHSFQWTPRIVTNLGARIEYHGVPENVGSKKDFLADLGPGQTIEQRIGSATVGSGTEGSQQLYTAQTLAVAFRVAFAINLSASKSAVGYTVLRGGYGTFLDRPPENAWLDIANNSFVYPAAGIPVPNGSNFLQFSSLLQGVRPGNITTDFPYLTLVQPSLPAGYVQDFFFKLQRQMSGHFWVDTGLQGSLGRKLLASDVINRDSLERANLPEIQYLSSQGNSNYFALATAANYRSRSLYVSLAYTWSHAIDNQSDPLSGSFFNLAFSSDTTLGTALAQQRPGFSTEFDSRADRGNADFDQRHNGVMAWIWDLPSLRGDGLRRLFGSGWNLAGLAALRSGLPFSVIDQIAQPAAGPPLLTRYADLIDPANLWQRGESATPGAFVILNKNAFCAPPACVADYSVQGNTKRNEFIGPGLFNVDLSLSKAFALPRFGDKSKLTCRADAFNVLNHANLNHPNSNLTSDQFGYASFGRVGASIGFPAMAPFVETARQIQLVLRVEF